MRAKYDLQTRLANLKGQVVALHFSRFLLGLITRDELQSHIDEIQADFDRSSAELGQISDECIEAVMLALES